MIRNLSALVALVLSISTAACTAPVDSDEETTSDELSSQASRTASFETFEGQDGQYYFNLVAANGQNVLRSEGYTELASAKNGIASVLENGQAADQFEVKQADNGDYYFTLEAKNGEVIGNSEMYSTKSNATRGAATVRTLVKIAAEAAHAAPRAERFELFSGEDQKTYFHLRAANGEIMLGSQGYASMQGARTGIASVLENGVDESAFKIAETADGKWVFRLVAANSEVIARGESYSTKSNATRAVERLTEILSGDVKTTVHK
jgi:uncharacterized protein YegP (UPF0339 family)